MITIYVYTNAKREKIKIKCVCVSMKTPRFMWRHGLLNWEMIIFTLNAISVFAAANPIFVLFSRVQGYFRRILFLCNACS